MKSDGTSSGRIVSSIDALPDLALDAIVALLPIRDAVRTSVLSKAWRYRWRRMPHLIFDKACFPFDGDEENSKRFTFQQGAITAALLQHELQLLRRFVLTAFIGHRLDFFDIWIPELARSGMQELIIEFKKRVDIELHPDIFSCQQLRTLVIKTRGVCRLPTESKGLPNLTKLVLVYVFVGTDAQAASLSSMISTCPKLTYLELAVSAFEPVEFNITASNLEYLRFCTWGPFNNIRIVAPKLSSATLSFDEDNLSGCNLISFLVSSTRIEELTLENWSDEMFAFYFPPSFQSMFNGLKYLEFYGCKSLQEDVLRLFKSCPILAHLRVHGLGFACPYGDFWEAQKEECFAFNQLEILEVVSMDACKDEVAFNKFVLRNAPLLRELNIKICTEETDFWDEPADFLRDVDDRKALIEDLLTAKTISATGTITVGELTINF